MRAHVPHFVTTEWARTSGITAAVGLIGFAGLSPLHPPELPASLRGFGPNPPGTVTLRFTLPELGDDLTNIRPSFLGGVPDRRFDRRLYELDGRQSAPIGSRSSLTVLGNTLLGNSLTQQSSLPSSRPAGAAARARRPGAASSAGGDGASPLSLPPAAGGLALTFPDRRVALRRWQTGYLRRLTTPRLKRASRLPPWPQSSREPISVT